MSHLGKSQSSTDPTPPPELVQQLASQRRLPGARCLTSTAIALSIGSRILRCRWHARRWRCCSRKGRGLANSAYAAVRTAVEITKESSDLFLPLKAVVGAMSVLIKNSRCGCVPCSQTEHLLRPHPLSVALLQQTSDNAEKVKEIERRVHSLSGVLASPVRRG
jgi:hypothetical protein